MRLRFVTFVGLCTFVVGCGESQERPEVIDKLRAIGVAAQPSVVVPSTATTPQVVKLTLHALLPSGQQVDSVQPYIDEDARFSSLATDLVVDANTLSYEDVGQLRYFKVDATFTAPTAEILQAAGGEMVRLRYGLDVVAGAESERVVGDVLMVPPDSVALSWQPVTVKITTPETAGAMLTDGATLSMTTTNSDGDSVKSGWYVSSGEIKNRRARNTSWEKPKAGDGVVIATARGSKSRSFAIDVRAVKVE